MKTRLTLLVAALSLSPVGHLHAQLCSEGEEGARAADIGSQFETQLRELDEIF